MNKLMISIMLVLLLLSAQAEETNSPPTQQQGRMMKPPPEAIAACTGKSEGTTVQFTTPRGDTLKGVCKQVDGVLAAMPPDGGAPPPKGSKPDEGNGGQSSN